MADSDYKSVQQMLGIWQRRVEAGATSPTDAAAAIPPAAEPAPSAESPERSPLASERHQQREFFVADLGEVSFKDDAASMEHPLFSLKAGDHRVRSYERQDCFVTIKPGADGCATIHDKDLWIYAISQLIRAKQQGCEISPTVRFTMYDFLVATNRPTAGVGYQRAHKMLQRLSGTRIETNIATGRRRSRRGFGLIDSWHIVERSPDDDRMVAVEIELPRWVYRSIEAMEVLTLSPGYFRLRKPLDRRIYELTRKHCGNQSKWRVSVTTLHEKSGSAATKREFRRHLKTLIKSNELPDYRMALDPATDTVMVYSR